MLVTNVVFLLVSVARLVVVLRLVPREVLNVVVRLVSVVLLVLYDVVYVVVVLNAVVVLRDVPKVLV